MSLNCIICDKHLTDAFPKPKEGEKQPVYNQPYGGTRFTSYGHYGSTVWDPLPGFADPRVWLEINICDDCMEEKADQGVILIVKKKHQPQEYDFVRPWIGPDDKIA